MEYAEAMAENPNLNPRNVERLITAISQSDPIEIAQLKPMVRDGKPVSRKAAMKRNVSMGMADPGRIPLVYDQSEWMGALDDEYDRGHPCGTIACIAGFAFVMTEQDAGRDTSAAVMLKKISRRTPQNISDFMTLIFAKFIGVERHIANLMSSDDYLPFDKCSAQPRHAVAMLEWFLETGKVDWRRARGWTRTDANDGPGWRNFLRRTFGKPRLKWTLTERESALRAKDAKTLSRAREAYRAAARDFPEAA